MGNALEAVEKWVKSHPYLEDIAVDMILMRITCSSRLKKCLKTVIL